MKLRFWDGKGRGYLSLLLWEHLFLSLIPIIVVSTALIVIANNAMQGFVDDMNRQSRESVSEQLNEAFLRDQRSFFLLHTSIGTNTLSNGLDSNPAQLIIIADIMSDFRYYVSTNDSFEDVFLYSKRDRKVAGSTSLMAADDFFRYHVKDELISEDGLTGYQWLNEVNKFSLKSFKTRDGESKLFMTIPSTVFDGSQYVLCAELNLAFYESILNAIITDDNGMVELIDEAGNTIITIGTPHIIRGPDGKKTDYSVKEGNLSVHYIWIPVLNGYLVCTTSKAVIWQKTQFIKSTLILISVCVVVVTSLCVYMVSRRKAKPVDRILQVIDTEKDSRMHTLESIEQYINNLQRDSMLQRREILQYIVQRLVFDGTFLSTDHLKMIEDSFPFPIFAVHIISVSNNIQYAPADILFYHIIKEINKIRDNRERDSINCLCLLQKNQIFCVYNYDNGVAFHYQIDKTYKSIKNDLSRTDPNLNISIGVGRECIKPELLKDSKDDAFLALARGFFEVGDDYVFYNDIVERRPIQIYFTQKHRNDLRIDLENGNMEKISSCIRAIVYENLNRGVGYSALRQLLRDILSVGMGILYEVNSDTNDWAINYAYTELDERQRLYDCLTHIEEVYRRIHTILETKSHLIGHSDDQIIDYLNKNYDKDVSLVLLADQFNKSPSYLSKYFKQHFGINYLDYLTKLRIEKAKEILRTTQVKIKDIPALVGINSYQRFSMIFKKQTGMTPQVYRDLNRQDDARS